MRQQFVECRSRRAALRECPWAAVIAKVEGGYHAFESYNDYRTWRNQR